MQHLHFDELDEGGRLVVAAEDGTRYAVVVDDRLRAALRPRPHAPTPDVRVVLSVDLLQLGRSGVIPGLRGIVGNF